MIPQAIAYAALAGLPSQYGLYSAFMGSLIYVFLGTIREISVGPTSLMSILTLQYTLDKPPQFMIMLTFLAGCMELLMAILNLGVIAEFISVPVTNAFTSATLLIVSGSQLKNLLGISYSSKGFADSLYNLLIRLDKSKLGDGLLAVFCCVFLLLFRQLKDIKIKSNTNSGKRLKKFLWYLSQASNMLLVIITSSVAYQWAVGTTPFKLSGKVEPGIPKFTLPAFEFEYQNRTIGFMEICSELGSGILMIPLVAVSANVAIAKAFTSGATLDAKQEMFTLGICNLLGSCVSSMPTCGALTRSAVSYASGVRTPFAGFYTAVMTLLALSLLTPYFYFIPQATLAAILIIAAMYMIDFSIPLRLWRKSRRDFWVWLGCIIACLVVGIEMGLLFGVLLNILQLMYAWARPEILLEMHTVDDVPYLRVTPKVGMLFPGIDHLREMVIKANATMKSKQPVVIDCSKFTGFDHSAAEGITGLAKDFHKRKQILILQNLNEKWHSLITSDNVTFSMTEQTLKNTIVYHDIHNRCRTFISSDEATKNPKRPTDPLIGCTELEELN
ncbi:hypothetical protein HA402_012554 [Bradysia odoriphaga]|nr:hypothetical protein HA402_012554 [Bradysia odoriphaga]